MFLSESRPTRTLTAELISEAPIVAIIEEMSGDLDRLRVLTPGSDARVTLERYFERLTAALAEARSADVWLTTEECAQLRGTTTQAITHLCRLGRLKCRKSGGAWQIHKDSAHANLQRVA